VSWIVPDQQDSEHPSALVSTGRAYVTKIINAVMQSSDWSSTAIFLAWDDWGGFYDNVVPPVADSLGYGIRVPAMALAGQERAAPGARSYRPLDSVATNRVPWANTGWAKTLLAATGSVSRMAPVAALTR
jgi:phospholipase C